MPRVNCKYFLGCEAMRDADTNEPIGGWWCYCDIHGNEQEMGYDCGKGCCDSYKRNAKKKEVRNET